VAQVAQFFVDPRLLCLRRLLLRRVLLLWRLPSRE